LTRQRGYPEINDLLENSLPCPDRSSSTSPGAIVYADKTGTIRRWNRVATELFGYRPADVLG
jgi:PAS domain-containing protein